MREREKEQSARVGKDGMEKKARTSLRRCFQEGRPSRSSKFTQERERMRERAVSEGNR